MAMHYTIHAYLPGPCSMAATDEKGEVGCLFPDGRFQVQFPLFVEAACAKYGYVRLARPVLISEAMVPEVVAVWRALPKPPDSDHG